MTKHKESKRPLQTEKRCTEVHVSVDNDIRSRLRYCPPQYKASRPTTAPVWKRATHSLRTPDHCSLWASTCHRVNGLPSLVTKKYWPGRPLLSLCQYLCIALNTALLMKSRRSLLRLPSTRSCPVSESTSEHLRDMSSVMHAPNPTERTGEPYLAFR